MPPARAHALLDLLLQALPHLRGGLNAESADFTARLLHSHLQLPAAAVVSREIVLAFVGKGSDHHRAGDPSGTEREVTALEAGEFLRTVVMNEAGCRERACPLSAALVAPLVVSERVVGALKLYYPSRRAITKCEERFVAGLASVFSAFLDIAELETRTALVTHAELEALRAQISPHFLFNTLATIAAMTRTDAERAHDLILDLAEFFRETLSRRRELVRLRDELRYVERYLRFEKARFGDRLSVEYAIDHRALDVLVPVLSVQPLVENAVVHGVAPKATPGRVRVRAALGRSGGLSIAVSDDGVGVSRRKESAGTSFGVALNNIHHRLIGLFGPASGLKIVSSGKGGTTVRFKLPAHVAEIDSA